MTKPNFWERFNAAIKGGEEKQITRFAKKLHDKIEDEIEVRENSIEDLKDKISDAQDALNEEVFNIDMEAVKTIDGTQAYVPTYLEKLQSKQRVVTELNEQIDAVKAEIGHLKALQETINNAAPKAEK